MYCNSQISPAKCAKHCIASACRTILRLTKSKRHGSRPVVGSIPWLRDAANPSGEPLTLNASGQMLSPSLREIPLAPAVAYGYAKAATHYQTAASVNQKATTAVEHVLGRHASAGLGSTAEALRLLASGDGCRGRCRALARRCGTHRWTRKCPCDALGWQAFTSGNRCCQRCVCNATGSKQW